MNKRGLLGKWATPPEGSAADKPDFDSKVSSNHDAKGINPESGIRKGQTLRLSPEAWKALKMLAVEEERTSHALLIEAVNDLFEKYGRKPIA